MEVVGIGVDMVDVGRMERVISQRPRFVSRVFTDGEISYCQDQANPARCYAARWAAREACRKALGGIGQMQWREVSVTQDENGAPSLSLEGASLDRARELGVSEVLVSMSHEGSLATAFCLAVKR